MSKAARMVEIASVGAGTGEDEMGAGVDCWVWDGFGLSSGFGLVFGLGLIPAEGEEVELKLGLVNEL